MATLFIMVPVALLLAAAAVIAFIWAVRSGQFDDPESSACRMLYDDQPTGRRDADMQSSSDSSLKRTES